MNRPTPNARVVALGGETLSHSARRTLIAATGVVIFALLTGVGGLITIPLPHTPVPITLQTLFVVLAGVTLGPRLGLLSMLFYLLLGSVGYHVFAGGQWGLTTVAGATGGYLIGFVLAQPLIGGISRGATARRTHLLAAVLAGHAVIFTCGVTWLAWWLAVGPIEAVALGVVPFVPGCGLKTLVAVSVGGPAARVGRRWLA